MSALVKQNNSNLLQYVDGQLVPVSPASSVQTPTAQPPHKAELTLKDIFGILMRRKWSVIFPIIFTVTLAVWYTLSTPPSYRANAVIQIEREGVQIVTTGYTTKPSGNFDSGKDPFLRTQYERLKSRTLSQKVIDELKLQDVLVPKQKEVKLLSIAGIKKLLGFTSESENKTPAPIDYNALFKKNLSIKPIDLTHLVEVVYEAPSAEMAKDVVQSLLNNYIQLEIESKSETGKYAKKVLTKQLAEARERLRVSEEALVKYANDKGILAFDDKQTRHVRNFQALDSALVTAENRRIEAQSLYEQMKRVGSVSTVLNNPVITSLKANLVRLEGDYQEMLKTFKPNYPDMVRLNQQIGNLRNKLNKEMVNIQHSMEADYLAAKSQEARIRSELKKFNTKMYDLQDSSLDYNTLKREVATNGNLFNQLLQRLEEVNVASAATTSNISIVEPAVAPFQRYRPKPKMNIALGLISGLLLGLGLAFLREALDQKINSPEELQHISGLPILGMIPRISRAALKKQSGMVTFKDPMSAESEAFRVLSTNLRFMSGKNDDRVILITSVRPEEGKSTTAANIACTYAQMGMKVLLVDADIRSSSLHKKLELSNKKGLTNYLKGEIDLVGITQPVKSVAGLYAITAGEYVSNPVSLLAHERMSYLTTQGAKIFDVVIVDAPPVLGFADSLILTSLATSTLIVAKEDGLDAAKIKMAIEQLGRVRNNILGFLLVKSKKDSAENKYYSKYQKKAKREARLALKKLKYT